MSVRVKLSRVLSQVASQRCSRHRAYSLSPLHRTFSTAPEIADAAVDPDGPQSRIQQTVYQGQSTKGLSPLSAPLKQSEQQNPATKRSADNEAHMRDGGAIKIAVSQFAGRRRFYKHVSVRESPAKMDSIQYEIMLDGHPLRSPGADEPFRLPTEAMALAVALEWDQQVTYKGIEPTYMPVTGIIAAAMNEVARKPRDVIDRCLRYLDNDTICYGIPGEEDERLYQAQQKVWGPLLRWIKREFSISIVKPKHMLDGCAVTEDTERKVTIILSEMDEYTLAATMSLTLDLKSLITALALVFRHITVEEAYQAGSLEELHQKSFWGQVDFYHELDEAVMLSQISAASTLLWSLSEDPFYHQRLKERIKAKLESSAAGEIPCL